MTIGPLLRLVPGRRGALVLACFVLAALLEGLSVGLVLPMIALLGGGAPPQASDSRAIALMLWFFGAIRVPMTLESVIGIIAAATVVKTAASFAGTVLLVRMVEQRLARLRKEAADLLVKAPPGFHTGRRAGETSQFLLDDIEKTGQAVVFGFKLLSGTILIAVWVGLLVLFSWRLTLLSMGIAAMITLLVRLRVRVAGRLGDEIASIKREMSASVVEFLSGLRVIWLTAAFHRGPSGVRETSARLADVQTRFARNTAAVNLVGENLGNLALIAMVYVSVAMFRIELATLIAFFFVLSRVLPATHRQNVVRAELSGFAAHAQVVADSLEALRRAPTVTGGDTPAPRLSSEIAFEDVSYRYPGGEWVLQGLSMTIPRGETVAITGRSGSGKSTTIDLLTRLIDPEQGVILSDGVPITAFTLDSWRRRFGVVSQDPFLFNDTIRRNIAYPHEDMPFEQIVDAAKLAHAHEFIDSLPGKYETRVSDRGASLSGGQRQRLTLARALAANPDVLVLDEATSALDTESEHLILDTLGRLAGRMTIVIVGHRLATLRRASRIYVLDSGRIAESGSHDMLIRGGGRYAQYWTLQER